MVVFGAIEWNKTCWAFSLATAIYLILFLFFITHEDALYVVKVWSLVFQPEVAYRLVGVLLLLMPVGGIVLFVGCLWCAVKWAIDRKRQTAEEAREKARLAPRVGTRMSLYGKNKKL